MTGQRYEVQVAAAFGTDWFAVVDCHSPSIEPEALFAEHHRELADEMAGRLNVRHVATQLRANIEQAPGARMLETDGGSIPHAGEKYPDAVPALLSHGMAVVPDAWLEKQGRDFLAKVGGISPENVLSVEEAIASAGGHICEPSLSDHVESALERRAAELGIGHADVGCAGAGLDPRRPELPRRTPGAHWPPAKARKDDS